MCVRFTVGVCIYAYKCMQCHLNTNINMCACMMCEYVYVYSEYLWNFLHKGDEISSVCIYVCVCVYVYVCVLTSGTSCAGHAVRQTSVMR